MELQLEFKTDRFKLTGPLPAESNAGNQFYGRDLAQWICDSLPNWNLDLMDEDWGWLVFTRRGTSPADMRHSLAVHGEPSENQTTDLGEWMVTLTSEQQTKWLGLVPTWKRIPYDRQLAADLIGALEELGVQGLKSEETK